MFKAFHGGMVVGHGGLMNVGLMYTCAWQVRMGMDMDI